MINKKFTHQIQNSLNQKVTYFTQVSGGSISECYRIECESGQTCFLKIAPDALIKAERKGLEEISSKHLISTPEVLGHGDDFLILEFVEETPSSASFWMRFAVELAEMHKCTSQHFGFEADNFIGLNPQRNLPQIPFRDSSTDWTDFYWTYRLIFQYQLLESNSLVDEEFKSMFMQLEKRIDSILSDSEEPPSLTHGDLWSGNFLCGPGSVPFLIDPAISYGHREADLAMTRLFGGFAPEFYKVYNETFPLPPNWEYRVGIYQLYHVMNHWNLFGDSYKNQAKSLILQYLD